MHAEHMLQTNWPHIAVVEVLVFWSFMYGIHQAVDPGPFNLRELSSF
jgi:hypothetical protein